MEKCVVITGAAGGIGRALIAAFKEAGYRSVGLDKVACPKDLECEYVQADLGRFVEDEEYADSVTSKIRAGAGSAAISVLVNNAAVQMLGSTGELSRSDWQATLNVNVQAPFFLAQALLPELSENKGCVVNISSIHARLTKPNFVAYATSKAALSGMTRAMAVDLGGKVRVNAIEPAAVETEMLNKGFKEPSSAIGELQRRHPIGRIGQPKDISALAVWLASDNASFVHGESMGLDGAISSRLHDLD